MSEFPELESGEPPVNKEFGVRDSWFDGYIEGNALIPQIYNIFAITTLAAVFRDMPEKWEEFGYSYLSENQLPQLRKKMTALHKAKGIVVEVSDHRLQHLWAISKNMSFMIVLDYIRSTKGEKPGEYSFIEPDAYGEYSQEINAFLDDPENTDKVSSLKDIITATRDGFVSPRGREMAAIYKATFDRRPTESGGIEVDDDLYDEIERLQATDPSADIKDLSRREFSRQAREIALSKVPEFQDSQWYANMAF